jgi:hypothetical protein
MSVPLPDVELVFRGGGGGGGKLWSTLQPFNKDMVVRVILKGLEVVYVQNGINGEGGGSGGIDVGTKRDRGTREGEGD